MTTEENFKSAIKELRKSGVKVRQNIQQCCRSCVMPEQLGMTEESEKTTPYLWTYRGQGRRLGWFGGKAYYNAKKYYSQPAKQVYFYFGNNLDAPRKAVEIFTKFGFDVDWNENPSTAVSVNLGE